MLTDALERITRDLNPQGYIVSFLGNKIFWWLNFGESIMVTWPRGQDVNDGWRNWLEANVGRQGFDWNWRPHYPENLSGGFLIEIKFRKKMYASQFLLLFVGNQNV